MRHYLPRILFSIAVLNLGSPLIAAEPPTADSPAAEQLQTAEEFTFTGDVTFHRAGEVELTADVWVPAGEGPFPALVMIHGGAWLAGNKFTMRRHAEPAARRGYTAVAISYRLAPAHKFPSQIEDCRAAVKWMRKNAAQYKIDPGRIASYGYSAGGQLAALLGASGDELLGEGVAAGSAEDWRVQAVVAGGAPCDFTEIRDDATTLAYWLRGPRRDYEELYRQASPRSFVSAADPPMFFYHGDNDRLVPLASPRAMRARLAQAGVRCELYTLEETGHIGAFIDKRTSPEALDFLDSVFSSTAE